MPESGPFWARTGKGNTLRQSEAQRVTVTHNSPELLLTFFPQ